jgi:hypothetical protein
VYGPYTGAGSAGEHEPRGVRVAMAHDEPALGYPRQTRRRGRGRASSVD